MSVSARLPCCLSRGPLKREFLDIYLSKSFGVGNFGNTEAMRVIFLWKCSKFNGDLENAENKQESVFCFWDKCIWIVCIELSLLRREYLSSAVNVLTKKSEDFACLYEWLSPTQLPSHWSRNMVKELPLRLNPCFGRFTRLLVDGSSQTGLFRH